MAPNSQNSVSVFWRSGSLSEVQCNTIKRQTALGGPYIFPNTELPGGEHSADSRTRTTPSTRFSHRTTVSMCKTASFSQENLDTFVVLACIILTKSKIYHSGYKCSEHL